MLWGAALLWAGETGASCAPGRCGRSWGPRRHQPHAGHRAAPSKEGGGSRAMKTRRVGAQDLEWTWRPCRCPRGHGPQNSRSGRRAEAAEPSPGLFRSQREILPDPLGLQTVHAPLAGVPGQPPAQTPPGCAVGPGRTSSRTRTCSEGGQPTGLRPNLRSPFQYKGPAAQDGRLPAPPSARGQASLEGLSRWQRLLQQLVGENRSRGGRLLPEGQ